MLRAGGAEVCLVDFEYAAAGQPLMDLAVLCMGCGLEGAEERNLLAAYLEVDLPTAEEPTPSFDSGPSFDASFPRAASNAVAVRGALGRSHIRRHPWSSG